MLATSRSLSVKLWPQPRAVDSGYTLDLNDVASRDTTPLVDCLRRNAKRPGKLGLFDHRKNQLQSRVHELLLSRAKIFIKSTLIYQVDLDISGAWR
jgi:hypothetical protein